MDVRPCIIGPELEINPDIVVTIDEEAGIPFPGILVSSREPVMLIGENFDVALNLEYCTNLQFNGKTGKYDLTLASLFEEGQVHVKGMYAGLFCDYFITPIDSGFMVKGDVGNHNVKLRVDTIGSICRVAGKIEEKEINFSLETLTDNTYLAKGFLGDNTIKLNMTYKEGGINVKGKNEKANVDYTIASLGDKIKMSGITVDKFTNLIFSLEDENQLHVTGKPCKVPVDYTLTVYENGVSIKGNTGLYHSDYIFVVGDDEEDSE